MKNTAIVAFLLVSVLICSTVSASAQQAQAKKYIAFRDDDISPFTHLDTLKAVNQVHIDENVPVTLAIIPHPIDSSKGNQLLQDDQFLTYMRSIASNHLFEFAQHGYSHKNDRLSLTPSEFDGRPYDDQYNRILKGRADLVEAFGMTPKTFIPPYNGGDRNTSEAAAALGFIEYSAGFSNVQYGYVNGMRIEGGFDIGAVNDTAFSASIQNAQNETERFLSDPTSSDTLTFTYHAGDFLDKDGAVDSHKIQQLTDFIDFLKTKGVLFTRLDRSSASGDGETVSPSPSAGQTVPVSVKSNPSIFALIGVGLVLVGIYTSARRQSKTRD